MDWLPFEVILALQPEITAITPIRSYFGKENPRSISIEGQNLVEGAEIYLQGAWSQIRIDPVEYTLSGDSASLLFNEQDLVPGSYKIYVRNPGGLETVQTFQIRDQTPADFYLSTGYLPLFPFSGEFNQNFDSRALPLAWSFRIALFPIKKPVGDFGLELASSWNYLKTSMGAYTLEAHMFTFLLNVVYQKQLPNQVMALNIRAGAGLAPIFNLPLDYKQPSSDTHTSLTPVTGLGISLQWLFSQHLFLDTGAEFIQIYTKHDAIPVNMRPMFSIGYKF
jgi:hypothetical protein